MAYSADKSGIEINPFSRGAPLGSRQRYSAILFVALVHIALFWGIAVDMHVSVPTRNVTDVQVILFRAERSGPRVFHAAFRPTLQAPEEVLVPEPDIAIAPDAPTMRSVALGGPGQKLAPRLDPEHLNARPPFPASFHVAVSALSLILRILVRPDGAVAEAEIARSSGDDELDRSAANYVVTNWHYLPASINGQPIEAWTTVVVRFASS